MADIKRHAAMHDNRAGPTIPLGMSINYYYGAYIECAHAVMQVVDEVDVSPDYFVRRLHAMAHKITVAMAKMDLYDMF
jgi:hypothetical protein